MRCLGHHAVHHILSRRLAQSTPHDTSQRSERYQSARPISEAQAVQGSTKRIEPKDHVTAQYKNTPSMCVVTVAGPPEAAFQHPESLNDARDPGPEDKQIELGMPPPHHHHPRPTDISAFDWLK